jgi:hypothetical protein
LTGTLLPGVWLSYFSDFKDPDSSELNGILKGHIKVKGNMMSTGIR